jgi:hypothetical protein
VFTNSVSYSIAFRRSAPCQWNLPFPIEGSAEISVRQISAREIRVAKTIALEHRTAKLCSR